MSVSGITAYAQHSYHWTQTQNTDRSINARAGIVTFAILHNSSPLQSYSGGIRDFQMGGGGTEDYVHRDAAHITSAKRKVPYIRGPWSEARLRALEALGILILSHAIISFILKRTKRDKRKHSRSLLGDGGWRLPLRPTYRSATDIASKVTSSLNRNFFIISN